LVFSNGKKRTINYIMKCLYCGKELPLLKRLAKGEFCSEEHRQSYQQEYSQLALNRLLQANQPEEPQKAGKAPSHSRTEEQDPSAALSSARSLAFPAQQSKTGHSSVTEDVRQESSEHHASASIATPRHNVEPAVTVPSPERKHASRPTSSIAPSAAPIDSVEDSAPVAKSSRAANSDATAGTGQPAKTVPTSQKDGRPEPKRWSSKKTGVAALADAVAKNVPEESTPQSQSIVESVLKTADVPPTESPVAPLVQETHTIAAPVNVQPEPQGPALAGNVFVLPPAASSQFRMRAVGETLVSVLSPALPRGEIKPIAPNLALADCLSSHTFVDAMKAPWKSRSLNLEFREFARRELVFEFRSTIQGPRLGLATQPAALPFMPVVAHATPILWSGPALEFPPIENHGFATAALELPTPESTQTSAAVLPKRTTDAGEAAPTQTELAEVLQGARDPEPVLIPQPLAFEGVQGGRGKAVQVFTATLRAAAVVDIPRYEGLPMRALMVLERSTESSSLRRNGNGGPDVRIAALFKSRAGAVSSERPEEIVVPGAQKTTQKAWRGSEG
jgi:hypothetical protein